MGEYMEAYLDNSATTKIFDSVRDVMVNALCNDYGNPSSKHSKGMVAEQNLKEAVGIIAKSIKAEPKEIILTSGGTESNNMALIGAALANHRAGKHIITTKFEHPSVHNPLIFLEEQGFRISYVSVDSMGHVNLQELLDEICDETIIVSIMYVNNEVGAVQNVEEIAKAIKAKKADVLFHVDAIQAFGKYRIYPKRIGIDMLSVSGHKIHGPKGSGFLYVRDKVKIKPIIFGGEQQRGMRSGTENVPAYVGLGQAVKEIYENHEQKVETLYELKKHMIDQLKQLPNVTVNAVGELDNIHETAPHIVSASFEGVRSEVLLHALEEKDIFVSSGSACSSNHPGVSGSLVAIGVKKELLDSTIRFSFSVNTTIEEIDYTISVLKDLLPKLRLFTRK